MKLSNLETSVIQVFNQTDVTSLLDLQEKLPQVSKEEISSTISSLRDKHLIYNYDTDLYALTKVGKNVSQGKPAESTNPYFSDYKDFISYIRSEIIPHLLTNHPEYSSLLTYLSSDSAHMGFFNPLYKYITSKTFPLYPGETELDDSSRKSSIEDLVLLWVRRLVSYGPRYQGKIPPVSRALNFVISRETYQTLHQLWEKEESKVQSIIDKRLSSISEHYPGMILSDSNFQELEEDVQRELPDLFVNKEVASTIFLSIITKSLESKTFRILTPRSSLSSVLTLLSDLVEESDNLSSSLSHFVASVNLYSISLAEVFSKLFSNSTFLNKDFRGLNVSSCSLSNSNFTGSNFSGCSLENTTFTSCNLQGVNFRQSNLSSTKFNSCYIQGTDFKEASMKISTLGNCTGQPRNIKVSEITRDEESLPELRRMQPIYTSSFALDPDDEKDARTLVKALQGILSHRSIVSSLLKFSSDVDDLRDWLQLGKVPLKIQELRSVDRGMFRGIGWLNKLKNDGTLKSSGFSLDEIEQLFSNIREFFGASTEREEKPTIDRSQYLINSFIEKNKDTKVVLRSDLLDLLSRSKGILYDTISSLPERVSLQRLQTILTSLISSIKGFHENSYVDCSLKYIPFPSVSRIQRQDSSRGYGLYGSENIQVGITLEPILDIAPKEVVQAFRVAQGQAESGTHAGVHYLGPNVCHTVITPMTYSYITNLQNSSVKKNRVWLISEMQSDVYQKSNLEKLKNAMNTYGGDVAKLRSYFKDWAYNLMNVIIQKAGDQGIDQVWVPKSVDLGGKESLTSTEGAGYWVRSYDEVAQAFGGKLTNLGTSVAPNPNSGIAKKSVNSVYVINISKDQKLSSKLSWNTEEMQKFSDYDETYWVTFIVTFVKAFVEEQTKHTPDLGNKKELAKDAVEFMMNEHIPQNIKDHPDFLNWLQKAVDQLEREGYGNVLGPREYQPPQDTDVTFQNQGEGGEPVDPSGQGIDEVQDKDDSSFYLNLNNILKNNYYSTEDLIDEYLDKMNKAQGEGNVQEVNRIKEKLQELQSLSFKLSWKVNDDFVTEGTDAMGITRRFNDKGELHSYFSPAVEYEGTKRWFQNGKLHRLDGPAYEGQDGYKAWYYNDRFLGDSTNNGYTQEQFEKYLKRRNKKDSQKLSWQTEEDFVKEYEDDYGNIYRVDKNGDFHSLYSPAVEKKGGNRSWYQNGTRHRLDGPAVEWTNGSKAWYYEGEWYGNSDNGYNQEKFEEDLRREGKIASQKLSWGEEDFVKEYKDEYDDLVRRNAKGLLHSLYSPAIEFSEGDKYWYQNGKLHRLDGPAKEHPDGHKEWYYDDNWYGDSRDDSRNGYNQEQFLEDLRREGKIASQKLSWGEEGFTKEYKDEGGDLIRENDKGQLHSLYSPAIEYTSGTKYWYQNNKQHRLDGPAVEYSDGTKAWYYEDERYGCSKEGYTQEKFEEDLRNEGKIASQKLSWGEEDFVREYMNEDGDLIRKNDKGQYHSLSGPAIERTNGNKYWYQNGKQHRLNGPAYEESDGYKQWTYEDDVYGTSEDDYSQEKFEEDLRREGKIASQKLSWGEEEEKIYTFPVLFPYKPLENASNGNGYTAVNILKKAFNDFLEVNSIIDVELLNIEFLDADVNSDDDEGGIAFYSYTLKCTRSALENLELQIDEYNRNLFVPYFELAWIEGEGRLIEKEASQKLGWGGEEIELQFEEAWSASDIFDFGYDQSEIEDDSFSIKLKTSLEKIILINQLNVHVVSVEFEEFDSGNRSHASAYFLYTLKGLVSDLTTLDQKIIEYQLNNSDLFLPERLGDVLDDYVNE